MDAEGKVCRKHQFDKSKCSHQVLDVAGCHRGQKDMWIPKERGHPPRGQVYGEDAEHRAAGGHPPCKHGIMERMPGGMAFLSALCSSFYVGFPQR